MREAKTISSVEREHLKDMLASPGYRVLQRITDSYIEAIEEGSKAVSQNDPLAHRDAIVNTWAYCNMAKRFRDALFAGVAYEIGQLTAPAEEVETPEAIRRQNIWEQMGMYGKAPDNFKPPVFTRR